MINRNFTFLDYDFSNMRLYAFVLAFTLGNVALPLLFHSFNLGGNVFLPIYFFTLICTVKFGWKAGALTAMLTPIANHLITGMPPSFMVPVVLAKGIALVIASHIVFTRMRSFGIASFISVIASYQLIGFVFESMYLMDIPRAFGSIMIAWPGILIQLTLGFAIIWSIRNYGKKIDG